METEDSNIAAATAVAYRHPLDLTRTVVCCRVESSASSGPMAAT